MSSAIRLFLRQSVIRHRLPFEVISKSPDPFWSEANQRVLAESIRSLERGEGQVHDLIDAQLKEAKFREHIKRTRPHPVVANYSEAAVLAALSA